MRPYTADAHRLRSSANQWCSVQGPLRSFLLNRKDHPHPFHPIGYKVESVDGDVFRHMEY